MDNEPKIINLGDALKKSVAEAEAECASAIAAEKARLESFAAAANPLIQWLNDHAGHPHHTVIVTPISAELVEGLAKFVKD